MRASDLLGARVVTDDGRALGRVHGLQCTLDGPSKGPVASPRLRALDVRHRQVGTGLGYDQPGQKGPWLIRAVVQRVHRNRQIVDWDDVAEVGDGEIRLRHGWTEDGGSGG